MLTIVNVALPFVPDVGPAGRVGRRAAPAYSED
jgi:hypothetical protein